MGRNFIDGFAAWPKALLACYSELNLNEAKAASRKKYSQYGPASQRSIGFNLIYYLLACGQRACYRLPEATADTPSAHHSGDLAWGPWHLQAATHTVHYHQQALNLTRYEWRLLHTLLKQPERIFSRDELMQAAWDYPDHSLARTVDSHIKTLRQKLKAVHPDDPIITQRGLGYGLKR